MLVINPDECIDCGVCEPECPVEAILPDTDDASQNWIELNAEYSAKWPNITQKGEVPSDWESFKDEKGKHDKYFSSSPGNS
tara:strand:+ start:2520 stop:2762 length:243 start_codon:yes stop_codon:yes gene_type:complete